MSKVEKFINFNGKIVSESKAVISITNRGFRYGDGLFESVRMVKGCALFLGDHLNRLFSGMNILKMEFPNQEIPEFRKLIKETCLANDIEAGGYVRLMVYRKNGGKYLPETNAVDFIIEAYPLDNEFVWIRKNLNLGIYSEFKKPINTLSTIKSSNAQINILSSIFAQENNFDDALILNNKNQIIEATSSNLFWIKDNFLRTPPLASGPLPGVMRKQILEIGQTIGYVAEEVCPTREDLLEADEIFLTNAIQGVKPVSGFQQKRYFRNQSLKIVKELNNYAANYIVLQANF